MNSGRFDAVLTSTPTYKKIATIPITNCGYFHTLTRLVALALLSFASADGSTWFGTEENLNMIAAIKKAAPKIKYGVLTLSILATPVLATTEPKIAKLTSTGPIVVPKLFIPPAMLSR